MTRDTRPKVLAEDLVARTEHIDAFFDSVRAEKRIGGWRTAWA